MLLHGNVPIHYITVASKSHPVLTKIQDKCHSHGEEVTVLKSMSEVHRFINNHELGEYDIVLFSYSEDVAIVSSQKEIKKRYLTFNKPIYFSSGSKSGINELNSSIFIGRVWALRRCMATYKDDDEQFWNKAYFKHNDLIELDSHSKLFLTARDLDEKTDISWDLYRSRLTCNINHSHPLMVHVPGNDKAVLYSIIGRYS
jgi:hypothetical protein